MAAGEEKDYDQALECLNKALRLDSNDLGALWDLCLLQIQTGDVKYVTFCTVHRLRTLTKLFE